MSDVKIRKAGGTWVVRAGGAVLGETTNALELDHPGRDPVIFFPRGDLAMAFLEASGTDTPPGPLGTATRYSIVTKSTVLKDAAVSYEAPDASAAELADHVAFEPGETVTVEQL